MVITCHGVVALPCDEGRDAARLPMQPARPHDGVADAWCGLWGKCGSVWEQCENAWIERL